MKKSTTPKTVTIVARVQFKNDPRKVCYIVRSSNGTDQYTTCLFDGKACSCNCPATKPCYHMTQVEAREADRSRAMSEAKQRRMAAVQEAQAVAQEAKEYLESLPERQPIAPHMQGYKALSQVNVKPVSIWQECCKCHRNVKVEGVLPDNTCDDCRKPTGERGNLNGNRGFSILR